MRGRRGEEEEIHKLSLYMESVSVSQKELTVNHGRTFSSLRKAVRRSTELQVNAYLMQLRRRRCRTVAAAELGRPREHRHPPRLEAQQRADGPLPKD
jgi:hypothetical protein